MIQGIPGSKEEKLILKLWLSLSTQTKYIRIYPSYYLLMDTLYSLPFENSILYMWANRYWWMVVLSEPMNLNPIIFISTLQGTDEKYELPHTVIFFGTMFLKDISIPVYNVEVLHRIQLFWSLSPHFLPYLPISNTPSLLFHHNINIKNAYYGPKKHFQYIYPWLVEIANLYPSCSKLIWC